MSESIPTQSKDDRLSWLKSPLILSIVGAILAIFVQIATATYSKSQEQKQSKIQHEQELGERAVQAKATLEQGDLQYQATLIEKAIEHPDPNRVIAKLQMLNELNLVPSYSEKIKALLEKEANLNSIDATASTETLRQYQASLIERALVPDDPDRVKAKFQLLLDAGLIPAYRERLQRVLVREQTNVATRPPVVPATAAVPVAPPATAPAPALVPTHASALGPTSACTSALVHPAIEGGWLFLGRTNPEKSKWVAGESGSQTIHFESSGLSAGDPDLINSLKGQCLSTLTAKYLREDGEPGKKVDARVKRAIPRGTRLRIVEIDDLGRDEKSQNQYPVIWARVVALAD